MGKHEPGCNGSSQLLAATLLPRRGRGRESGESLCQGGKPGEGEMPRKNTFLPMEKAFKCWGEAASTLTGLQGTGEDPLQLGED